MRKWAFTAIAMTSLIACSSGSGGAIASADGINGDPPGSDAGSVESGGPIGVGNIYKTCAPVTLSESLANATQRFTLRYPSSWTTGLGAASNQDQLWREYSRAGSATSASDLVSVYAQWGWTALDASDVQRMLDQMVSDPHATVRRFTIGGAPAIAWWVETEPAQPGCTECPSAAGPNFINIGLGASRGLQIFQVLASARIDAPDDIFCEIQAIEGSLVLAP